MSPRLSAPLSRRTALAAGLVAALGITQAPGADARYIMARGMTGGGLAKFDAGEEPGLAHFSLFASSMQLPEGTTLFLGTIRWIEAATGLRLESTEITQCRPLRDRADGAEIRGRMSANGEGSYPFVIHAFDTGGPGSGQDAIRLDVNGEDARDGEEQASPSDFTYEVTAALVAGDVQWVIVDATLPD
jgi:hypothetical protein